MNKIEIVAPWVHYAVELKAMFEKDDEITVVYNDGDYEVKLFVDNDKKAEALSKLLPHNIKFGKIDFNVIIIPANSKEENFKALLEAAFEGNPVLEEVLAIDAFDHITTYAMFKKEVVQFYDDNMQDPHGNTSTLYANMAKDLFVEKAGVFYSTSED